MGKCGEKGTDQNVKNFDRWGGEKTNIGGRSGN